MVFLNQEKIESLYQKASSLWGFKPNMYVKEIPKLLKAGRVLDLGVGEGRNALFLSENGFEVTGVDIAPTAVQKFLDFARDKGVNVKGVVKDAQEYKFEEDFDAIICTATLHYFSKKNIKNMIDRMKEHTAPGGLNLITAFTKKDVGFNEYPEYFFVEDEYEMHDWYKDWEIIKCEGYEKRETHGWPHIHHIAVLFARKPIK